MHDRGREFLRALMLICAVALMASEARAAEFSNSDSATEALRVADLCVSSQTTESVEAQLIRSGWLSFSSVDAGHGQEGRESTRIFSTDSSLLLVVSSPEVGRGRTCRIFSYPGSEKIQLEYLSKKYGRPQKNASGVYSWGFRSTGRQREALEGELLDFAGGNQVAAQPHERLTLIRSFTLPKGMVLTVWTSD